MFLLVSTILAVSVAISGSDSTCSQAERDIGSCKVGGVIADDGALLTGVVDGNSNSASPPDAAANSGRGGGGVEPAAPVPCIEDGFAGSSTCSYGVVAPVRIADVAHFPIGSNTQQMEPDGWVVAKLPANFYSSARTETVTGTLLGSPAEVRFIPIRWNWDYGDGRTAQHASAGSTWSALGLREFDATPTSHIYQSTGTYTVRLSVTYRAEYRYGTETFIPIIGTLTRPANDLHISSHGAKTVLVDQNCTQNPRGPGC